MTLPEFVARALGTPFRAKGRDWRGVDCWGLVYLAYRELRGVDLPTYADDYAERDLRGSRALGGLVAREAESWRLVRAAGEPSGAEDILDVVVLRLGGRPVHVGLYLGEGRFLHAEEKIGVVVERLASPMWARRLEGIYRRAG